jgi:hypothetical protein
MRIYKVNIREKEKRTQLSASQITFPFFCDGLKAARYYENSLLHFPHRRRLTLVKKPAREQNVVRRQKQTTTPREPVNIKSTIFWHVMTCSPVYVYRRLQGTYCLHLQSRGESQLSKKASSKSHLTSCLLLSDQLILKQTKAPE